MSEKQFIACGMYAFNDRLKQAWQELFDHFYAGLESRDTILRELVFNSGEAVLRDPGLLLGHSCGYPLMTKLRDGLMPLCVPVFDVPGCSGRFYSSHIVVPADSDIASLQECRGLVVAMNSADSNSGMNVLRYEMAGIGASPGFFTAVETTASHFNSMVTVAERRAQVAAIDCVSYQLIAEQDPTLRDALRSIGYCQPSCGLPFVVPRHRFSSADAEPFCDALNQALTAVSAGARQQLHLLGFETVNFDDYQSILEMENHAIKLGYPSLN